jgi:hypothetical protein
MNALYAFRVLISKVSRLEKTAIAMGLKEKTQWVEVPMNAG